MTNLKLTLSLVMLFFTVVVWGQSHRVSGRVTKEGSTDSLSAVTITVKGTKTTTISDNGGRFLIMVPDNNSVLVFSSIGFTKTEVAVRDRSILEVSLTQESSTLNDVVVIGYGTARKKDLTGATASLAGSALEKIPLSNVAEAMTGRLAGVQVTTTDGAPGADIVIRVRGGGSVTQDNCLCI